jgi:hypothetical protein
LTYLGNLYKALRGVAPGTVATISMADKAKEMTLQQQLPNVKTTTQAGTKTDVFNEGGQYPPGEPLIPLEPSRTPQQFQFTVGRNLIITPRSEENMTPFDMLRGLADAHDISRLCIEMRKEQIAGMKYDIVPTEREDKELTVKYETQIKEIKEFFKCPSVTQCDDWYDWIGMVLEDVLVIDALTLFKRRTRGGKLYSLEVVDGARIKPLIDSYGRRPMPPIPAYQQIIFGYPRGGSPQETTQGFTLTDLIYKPKNKRSFSMYGFSPVEYIIIKVNMALRRDQFLLSYFSDGNIPDGGLYSLPAEWDAEKIQQFQEWFDVLMQGNSEHRSGNMKFLPDGKYTATKVFEFHSEFDEWLARITANAFGVNPQHFIKMMTRSTGETQEQLQTDIGLMPLIVYLEGLLTSVIQEFWDVPGLTFKFIDEKQEDEQIKVNRNVQYVKTGILKIDEVRAEMGLDPLLGSEDVPAFIATGTGPIYITPESIESSMTQMQNVATAAQPITDTTQTVKPNKPDDKEVDKELKRMEQFYTNRLKKKTKRQFESNIVDTSLQKFINNNINKCNTPNQIRTLFKVARNKPVKSAAEIEAIRRKLQKELEDIWDDVGTKFEKEIAEFDSTEEILNLLKDYVFLNKKEVSDSIVPHMVDLNETAFNDSKDTIENILGEEIELRFSSHIAEERAKDYAGDLIKGLEESTHDMLRQTIASSVANEEDYDILQQRLIGNYGFSDARAETIARTETGILYNQGFVQAALESDLVDKVLVEDGDDDSECADANGSEWELDYAMDNPLSHPNCTRSFTYILKDDASKSEQEE